MELMKHQQTGEVKKLKKFYWSVIFFGPLAIMLLGDVKRGAIHGVMWIIACLIPPVAALIASPVGTIVAWGLNLFFALNLNEKRREKLITKAMVQYS